MAAAPTKGGAASAPPAPFAAALKDAVVSGVLTFLLLLPLVGFLFAFLFIGLPVTYRDRQWPKLEDAMKRDKKTRAGLLRFVVLDRIGSVSRIEGPDPALLLSAYAAITDD